MGYSKKNCAWYKTRIWIKSFRFFNMGHTSWNTVKHNMLSYNSRFISVVNEHQEVVHNYKECISKLVDSIWPTPLCSLQSERCQTPQHFTQLDRESCVSEAMIKCHSWMGSTPVYWGAAIPKSLPRDQQSLHEIFGNFSQFPYMAQPECFTACSIHYSVLIL